MSLSRLQQHEHFAGLGIGGGDLAAEARDREEERWRRARALGILGTVVAHFLILFATRGVDVEPMLPPDAAAGPAMGDIRPAGGGSGLTMVEVRAAQAPAEEEVVTPVPVPEEVILPEEIVPVTPEPAPTAAEITPPSLPGTAAPGTGGQGGTATGSGNADGDGSGGGGDSDGGASRIIPPTPRGIFIPPSGQPASARGQEITVWVFVTANGRVDRDQIRLEPPTSDARYNRRLMQSVAEWVFEPARENGRPVPVWYPFQIIL